jgi:hypothetical protein
MGVRPMSAEIINLRRARKAKARSEHETRAADNRVAFGRTKAEKALAEAERRRAETSIEGHRRETEEE